MTSNKLSRARPRDHDLAPLEMGIRHEGIIFIRENGAENMTKWTGSPDEPAVLEWR